MGESAFSAAGFVLRVRLASVRIASVDRYEELVAYANSDSVNSSQNVPKGE